MQASRIAISLLATLLALVSFAPDASARGKAGIFDYYVLVLSWSPTHCSSNEGRGDDDAMQCRSGRPYGFVLHGLWPQYERGWPEYCSSGEPEEVSDTVMEAALRLSPSQELVRHEWRRHGVCSGMGQSEYFEAAARAVGSIAVPPAYDLPKRPFLTTASEVRRRFLKQNPSLRTDGVAATCRRNEVAELWVCLDRSLKPRTCSEDVLRKHCGARSLRMRAVRGDWPR